MDPGAIFSDEHEAWQVRMGLHLKLAEAERNAADPDGREKMDSDLRRIRDEQARTPGGGWM